MTELAQEADNLTLEAATEAIESMTQDREAVMNGEAEVVEPEQQEETLELTDIEQAAYDEGWRPKDQYEGNPDNWKPALNYIAYGEFRSEIDKVKSQSRRKEQEFDDRINNLNKLHTAQQAAAISDLKAKQRQAVEEADTAEYDRLQTQIDTHKPVEVKPSKDPVLADWETANPWINDESDKAKDAQALWNAAARRDGATVKTALDDVDAKISVLYPAEKPTNPRRDMPSTSEQSTSPRASSRRRNKELTMSDLTSQERQEWQMFGSTMFGSEKEFLKAVTDSRKDK